MKFRIAGAALSALLLACATAQAGTAPIVYGLNLTGSNIVGTGDVDGTGVGTITFDPAGGMISWSITYTNLDAIVGWAIHQGGAGVNGGQAAANTSTAVAGSGVYSGSASFTTAFQNQILSAGSNAYFIIKTSAFPSGAVRDQLGTEVPTPGALCVIGLAGIAATRRRR